VPGGEHEESEVHLVAAHDANVVAVSRGPQDHHEVGGLGHSTGLLQRAVLHDTHRHPSPLDHEDAPVEPVFVVRQAAALDVPIGADHRLRAGLPGLLLEPPALLGAGGGFGLLTGGLGLALRHFVDDLLDLAAGLGLETAEAGGVVAAVLSHEHVAHSLQGHRPTHVLLPDELVPAAHAARDFVDHPRVTRVVLARRLAALDGVRAVHQRPEPTAVRAREPFGGQDGHLAGLAVIVAEVSGAGHEDIEPPRAVRVSPEAVGVTGFPRLEDADPDPVGGLEGFHEAGVGPHLANAEGGASIPVGEILEADLRAGTAPALVTAGVVAGGLVVAALGHGRPP